MSDTILNYVLDIAADYQNWSLKAWVLFGIGCYAATSYFFLQFPQLLHPLRRFPSTLLVRHSSHRGGASERPENSIAAFRHAVSLGSQLLEMDVHKTLDGIPVVVHDGTLLRLTGSNLEVRSTPFKELPPLNGRMELAFPFNKDVKLNYTQEVVRIPTLKEVFETFPTASFNIDCKAWDQDLCQKIEKLIVEHKLENQVIWGSGNDSCSKYLYSLNPNIMRFFSVKQMLFTMLKYYTGILPFCRIHENAFEIPILTKNFSENITRVAAERNRKVLGWVVLRLFNFILTSKGLFRHLQKRGIKVILWVANDDEDFEKAYKILGVDGVMTDFPSRLTTYLSHHDPNFHRFNGKQK